MFSGSVHQQSLENRPAVFSTREGIPPDDDSYMGYSTIVGHFKEGEQYEGIAVGMPRGNAADVNGDKKLDLIVGAPMHTEPNNEMKYDVGRVYVFYQSSDFLESFNTSHFIDGINSKSRFGHAVSTLGDLNQDGYDDFAIGAPYDGPNGRGAVYIYYGSQKGIREKYGQVIYAETIESQIPLKTFGFSVTGGMDLDGNEYPDMAVGAYLSDSAFFFRSRPVVLVDAYVQFQTDNKQIDIKKKNCNLPNGQKGTCTSIDFCIKYTGKGIPQRLYFTVQYILDSRKPDTPRMGFLKRGTHTFNNTVYLSKDNTHDCKVEEVYIKNDIRDKLTPLEAEVKYFLMDDASAYQHRPRNPQSQLRPVLDLNSPPSRKDAISVQKNCGNDNICIPDLHVNVTSNVEKYLLGSKKDLEFNVIVSNFGEDSFETTFEMKYPEGIHYKKFETESNMPGILCSPNIENRTITCDIGNPLPQGKIALFKILLQPYYEVGMASSYEFDVFVNSTNPESEATMKNNHKHISIDIWIDAALELRGDSYPPTAYYNESLYTSQKIVRESDIGPQVTHVYYVTNRGPMRIAEAEIFILWPLKTLGGEDLLYLLDQPYTQGDVKCDTTMSNYKHYELDYHRQTIWDRLKIDISGVEKSSAEKLAAERQDKKVIETGRGVSSGIGVENKKDNNIDIKNNSGDSSLVFAGRYNESKVTSEGKINTSGESVTVEARSYTNYINGIPHTTWHNITTVRDAKGNIIRTYSNDNSKQASGNTGFVNLGGGTSSTNVKGIHRLVSTTKQPKRIYTQTDNEHREEQENVDYSNIGLSRLQEEKIRQEDRRKVEERERKERLRLREDEIRRNEERQREERLRVQQEERRRLEERERVERLKQQEEERRKQLESWRASEEQRRYQESIRRQTTPSSVGSSQEVREEEERRRYYELNRARQESTGQQVNGQDSRYYEEHAYEVGGGPHEGGTERQYGQGQFSHQGQGSQTFNQGNYQQNARHYGVYHDIPRDPSGQTLYNKTYTVESSATIPIEVSGSQSGQHGFDEIALGGGFTAQTVDLGTGSSNAYGQSGSAYGSGSTNGHEVYGKDGFISGQGAFPNGEFRREWHAEGSSSQSGRIPPTIIHSNRIEGDNVPTDRPNLNNRHRGRRMLVEDPYAEIEALVKCNSTTCNYIRCVVGSLDKDKEVAIALRSRLNIRAVKDLTSSQSIKLSSMMVGKISKLPDVGRPREQILRKHEIFTEVPAKEPELVPEVAPLWIYVVSAVAGVVMLLLLIWILSKCGFFKRNRPSSAPERQPLNRNGYHSGDEAL
ncbi:hypothetical protein NQ314_002826 [Rhamnusium bicolor]|uniref:Integrin alpha-PS2 n=1 Tax=Rhamnusium bicolor TaxID=1586634 RepID=A0AAV8ZQB8_9CUCU|nr:hypothetical protein NQ314_002826 [Rhamnusium bicolor]